MKNKKYELDYNDSISVEGHKLYRIISLVDMPNVAKGDKGGYIEQEYNLDHYGNSWIFVNARVYDSACVSGNARIYGNAIVCEQALVCENACVYENARIFEHARVYGDTGIFGRADIYGHANIFGAARVYGDTRVYDDALIFENARICGNAIVCGESRISGHAHIRGDAWINGEAAIEKNSDYFCAQSFGSVGRTTTLFHTRCGGWLVSCGCFTGSIGKFRDKVKKVHRDSPIAKEYLLLADLMELRTKREK